MPSVIEIDPVVLVKKTSKCPQCIFATSLLHVSPLAKGHGSSFEQSWFTSPKNASCYVWLKLNEWFDLEKIYAIITRIPCTLLSQISIIERILINERFYFIPSLTVLDSYSILIIVRTSFSAFIRLHPSSPLSLKNWKVQRQTLKKG